MAEAAISWRPQGAWADVAVPGPFGAAGAPGITATLLDGFGLATIIPVAGGEAGISALAKARLGIGLPQSPSLARSGEHELIWAGAGQWLLRASRRDGFAATIAALSAHAAVVDQSQARLAVRLTGPRVREVLAKGVMVDLHPGVFPVGAVALTMTAYVGVHLWRLEDGPDGAVFEIMVPRSFAGSFWSWFTAAAAEFGCVVHGQD